ncbi:EF-hand domain-containing protein [Streptomyces sp. NPDC096205]|uniref:EF-hand domain-containing protein n=1 Tax=Streptomyces sp. NPDC096205 TaxID=3366081 RepID=UPI00382ED510
MDNNFFQCKTGMHFDSFDVDGVITREDFEQLAQRFLTGIGFTRESSQGRSILDGAGQFWDNLAQAADGDQDGRITRQEFSKAVTDGPLGSPDDFAKAVRPWAEAVVQAADVDGDGRLSTEEYRRMLGALSEGREAPREMAFTGGPVAVDVAIEAVQQFYASGDPSHPTSRFFGQV